MNIKYYLRGLGIGLVITTLILTISHRISNPKENEEQTQSQTTSGSVIAYTKEDKTKDQEETTKQPEEPTTQQNENNDDDNTEITIDIQGVYYGTDVSDLLYDAGVITDKQEFSDYLKEHGYDTIIREGSYTFTKGDTFENLAKIITRSE